MLIDVHAHYFPDDYLALLEKLGDPAAGPARSVYSQMLAGASEQHLEARFAMMDRAGVQRQALSVGPALPYFANESAALDTAHAANDSYAAIVSRFPNRFVAFGVTPLPHIDSSLREIDRALDELHMAGITMGISVLGRMVTDPVFEPIYAELDRRHAVLFMHPAGSGCCSPFIANHGLSWPIGAPMEDTVFVSHLIQRAIPLRYPHVKIIVPHMGGLLPMVLDRLDHQRHFFAANHPEAPSATVRRLWYDTVGHGSIPALQCAHRTLGSDRLVYGSDYPFQLHDEYLRSVSYIRDAGFSPEDVDRILNRNAESLFT
jgi:predicted TIM-barrel fold metal-dependent hydrolase